MSHGKEMLLITPGATRVGGNLLALQLLKWLDKNTEIRFRTLIGYGGSLEAEFGQLAETTRILSFPDRLGPMRRITDKAVSRLRLRERAAVQRLNRNRIGVIYSNSLINHFAADIIDRIDAHMITSVFELESVVRMTGFEKARRIVSRTDRFISISDAVRDFLVLQLDVPPEKITVIKGHIPIPEMTEAEIAGSRRDLRESLGLSQGTFVVGASGTLNWRKAPEIFIQIAARYFSDPGNHKDTAFVWVGGADLGDLELYQAEYDVRKLGLSDRVFFLPHTSEPLPVFAGLDAFALTSREEPFGMVCLESASFGVPQLAFENSGGAAEFIEDDAGILIPYLDTVKFADAINDLATDRSRWDKLSKRAAEKVRDCHDIEDAAPRIADMIQEFLQDP